MATRAPLLLLSGALLLVAASACGSSKATKAPDGGSGGSAGSAGSGGTPAGADAGPGSGGASGSDAAAGADRGSGGAVDAGAPNPLDATAETANDAGSGDGDTPGGPLPAGIPAGYRLLLDQPFAAPTSLTAILAGNPPDWTHGTEDGGYLQYGGVGYVPPNPPIPESFTSFALVSAMKFGSFVMEVELMQRNPQNAPQVDMCIVFGIKSETEYYYAHVAQGHTDRWHNVHIINNAPRRPITRTDNGGIRWGANQWHKFRVVRELPGGNIAVYMDADLTTPILTATDTTFGEGYVGFATHQDSGRIRNLKVWAASATTEPAPAGFFR